jgi:hypothetical protein
VGVAVTAIHVCHRYAGLCAASCDTHAPLRGLRRGSDGERKAAYP